MFLTLSLRDEFFEDHKELELKIIEVKSVSHEEFDLVTNYETMKMNLKLKEAEIRKLKELLRKIEGIVFSE